MLASAALQHALTALPTRHRTQEFLALTSFNGFTLIAVKPGKKKKKSVRCLQLIGRN